MRENVAFMSRACRKFENNEKKNISKNVINPQRADVAKSLMSSDRIIMNRASSLIIQTNVFVQLHESTNRTAQTSTLHVKVWRTTKSENVTKRSSSFHQLSSTCAERTSLRFHMLLDKQTQPLRPPVYLWCLFSWKVRIASSFPKSSKLLDVQEASGYCLLFKENFISM